jgi:hypothetical protein
LYVPSLRNTLWQKQDPKIGKEGTMKSTMLRTAFSVFPALIALLLLSGVTSAQTQVKGAISGRSGATMTVKT